MSSEAQPPEPRASTGAFPTTQWSVVMRVGADSESKVRDALETLCRQYWYPLYAFVRRNGRAHHEAEDCTQEFLARLLSGGSFGNARQEKGSFRTFLLSSLRNFLSNEWRRTQTIKRGGGQTVISFNATEAEERFSHEPADANLTPEQAFDRNWALEAIARAFSGLREEYEKTGRRELFDALGPLVLNDAVEGVLEQRAQRLKMTTHACTVALHRLRRRLGDRLRADVIATVGEQTEVDAEVRHLIAAMSQPPAR